LILDQKEFSKFLEYLDAPPAPYISDDAWAETHFYINDNDGPISVVCLNLDIIDNNENADSIEIAGLLCHEAVHIWQRHKKWIGENKPGKEQEAVAIQFLSVELMREYVRQIALPPENRFERP
jgi:hypothetical protein